MILAVDVGNTNINLGIFSATRRGRSAENHGKHANRLVKRFSIPTKDYNLKKLKRGLGRVNIDATIICSVVPKLSGVFNREIRRLTGRNPYIIGKNISVPIRNLYRRPREVGSDRLVNAYAGIMLYGAPLIVVDFGTAVTFDVISKDKEYLGGMIFPGLDISLDGLYKETALLPKIKLEKPKEFIGRDSKNSMLSGIVYGFAALTDNLLKRLKSKIGHTALSIGTGGSIRLIGKYCRLIDEIDPDLTLKGLNLLKKRYA